MQTPFPHEIISFDFNVGSPDADHNMPKVDSLGEFQKNVTYFQKK